MESQNNFLLTRKIINILDNDHKLSLVYSDIETLLYFS